MSQTASKSINSAKTHSIWNIRSLTIMALMTALLIVSTYIKIPLPFSTASITAQTLMVNLIGLLLSPLQTLAVMVTWILLSVVGIGGSLGKLLGPAGGYRYGNLVAAVLISMFCCKVKKVRWQTAFIIIVGIPVIYLFGAVQMKYVTWITFCFLGTVKALAAASWKAFLPAMSKMSLKLALMTLMIPTPFLELRTLISPGK